MLYSLISVIQYDLFIACANLGSVDFQSLNHLY